MERNGGADVESTHAGRSPSDQRGESVVIAFRRTSTFRLSTRNQRGHRPEGVPPSSAAAYADWCRRLDELEKKDDAPFDTVFDAIRGLLSVAGAATRG
jgi:hypothetical protein